MKKYIFPLFTLIVLLALSSYQFIPTKRYAVFAGYNPNGIIAPYVITYLKGLNEVTDGIVYITDSNLKETEKAKLKDINIIYQQHTRHNEYDWGSYKRGYLWLKENNYLKHTSLLILANDSCIAPLTSFAPLINDMQKKEADFYGNTANRPYYPHLQSYFLIFNHKTFTSDIFDNLLTSVTHQHTKSGYINKYEILISTRLRNAGFKMASYIPLEDKNDIYKPQEKLITKYNNQFIKLKTLKSYNTEELQKLLQKSYPKIYNTNILPILYPYSHH